MHEVSRGAPVVYVPRVRGHAGRTEKEREKGEEVIVFAYRLLLL